MPQVSLSPSVAFGTILVTGVILQIGKRLLSQTTDTRAKHAESTAPVGRDPSTEAATDPSTEAATAVSQAAPSRIGLSSSRRSLLVSGLKKEAKRRWKEEVTEQGLFAPFSPTPMPLIHKTLKVLGVNASSVVYDIGCGDGRWLIEACSAYGCTAVGVEIDAQLCIDVNEADITPATIVIVYSGTKFIKELAKAFRAKLAIGTRIVSVQFPIPGWALDSQHSVDGFAAYMYTAPHAWSRCDLYSEGTTLAK